MKRTLFLVAALCAAAALVAETPCAEALKISQAPKLDGKLDEPFWRTAKPLGDFQLWEKADKGKPTSDTEVKLAYDNAWLYVGLKCDNSLQKLILSPKVKNHDGPVGQDESIELFLTADAKGKTYYHFMLSCFDVKAEQRFLNGVRERETWDLPWRSATAISDKGWTAEIAIPLYILLEYGDLDHIRLNVARARRCPVVDSCNVITHETQEVGVWRPVVSSFHEPESFGALAPLKPDKLAVPFLVSLENAEVKPYFAKDGKNYYRVDITLKGANPTGGEAELAVTDRPVGDGETTVVRERVAVKSPIPQTVSLAVPAPTPTERSIVVDIRDAASGEVFQSVTTVNPTCLKVMSAYLDRNYYTAETEAVAVAEIALTAETLKGMTVAVEMAGKVLGSAAATRETRVGFPIGNAPVGSHPVKIILKREDGAPFCAIAAELVKRTPNPGREVKIDQINRVILKNGEPVFPFGPVMSGVNPEKEPDFKAIADAGCDAFFQWNHTGKKNGGEYLPVAEKYGLQLITTVEDGWPSLQDAKLKTPGQLFSAEDAAAINAETRGSELTIRGHLVRANASPRAKTAVYAEYIDKCLPVTERIIEDVKDAGNFLAYNSFDEPYDDSRFKTTPCLDAVYKLTRRLDGYHPVMLNYSSYIPEGDEYVTCCDILCTDPYWVPGGDASWAVRRAPNFVSKIVAWTDRRAEKFRKIVWTIPLGYRWSNSSKRGISGPEQDCQNFLAIIHGAKGLFWFCYPMPETGWNNLKKSIEKIKVIGPMAVQPRVAQTIEYRWASAPETEYKVAAFNPDKDEFPDVQGRVFRDPKGGLVLLAANSRYYPVTATFAVSGLSGAVADIFGGAPSPVRNGEFQERLEPFAVRAYRLDGAPSGPLAVKIASLRPAVLPPPEAAYPVNARENRKNAFPNPSFEDETVSGAADYYFGGTVVTDAAGAKFGKKYLRLTNNDPKKVYIPVQWKCGPRNDKDTAYVWSVWAKGAKGGERLWARSLDEASGQPGEARDFSLTTEWKRYALPVTVPARTRPLLFELRLWDHGEIRLDGLQLEKGGNATEFEE